MSLFENFYECPICGAKIVHSGSEKDDDEAIYWHLVNHTLNDLLAFIGTCMANNLHTDVKIKSRLRRR